MFLLAFSDFFLMLVKDVRIMKFLLLVVQSQFFCVPFQLVLF